MYVFCTLIICLTTEAFQGTIWIPHGLLVYNLLKAKAQELKKQPKTKQELTLKLFWSPPDWLECKPVCLTGRYVRK
jgi:hypothetical protein